MQLSKVIGFSIKKYGLLHLGHWLMLSTVQEPLLSIVHESLCKSILTLDTGTT